MPRSHTRTPRGSSRGRFSRKRKPQAVLRLLQGEELDTLARELKVNASALSAWRQHFLQAGEAALKSRAEDGRDIQIKDLKAMVGELTMRLEVSRKAVKRLQDGHPLAEGRSSKRVVLARPPSIVATESFGSVKNGT